MDKQKHTVVLEIGGEGGSVTLFETETPQGRQFTVAIVDDTLHLIEEGERIERVVGASKTWRGALKHLDTYPWHMLYPLQIHADYADRLLKAAEARLAREQSSHGERQRKRWREKCRQPERK